MIVELTIGTDATKYHITDNYKWAELNKSGKVSIFELQHKCPNYVHTVVFNKMKNDNYNSYACNMSGDYKFDGYFKYRVLVGEEEKNSPLYQKTIPDEKNNNILILKHTPLRLEFEYSVVWKENGKVFLKGYKIKHSALDYCRRLRKKNIHCFVIKNP